MGHIPGRKQDRFYEKKLVVEGIAILPPLVTAATGAAVSLGDPGKRTLGWWLAAATAWLALASVVKILHAAAQDRDRKRLEDYAGLRGALCVLYGSACRAAQLDHTGGDSLRVTLHRVVRPAKKGVAAETLEQLLPYIGGKGGPAGRTFSIRSGVIGKAAREKMPVAVERGSQAYPDFVHELIRDWAYTEEDAREISSDRQAWMAVPIVIANAELTAVVSLDSSIRGFFTDHVQHAVLGCCRGITDYIVEVY